MEIPGLKTTVGGINIEEYSNKFKPGNYSVYDFKTAVGAQNLDFELVKGTYSGQDYLYETAPIPQLNYKFNL